MHTEIRKVTTLEIDGTFFEERILMVRPENTYIEDCDMKKLCYNIFESVREHFKSSRGNDSTSPVNTEDHLNDIQEVFKEEFLSICNQNMTQPTAKEKIHYLLTYTFPSKLDYRSAPDVIGSEKVSMHITRILLQTMLDQLHSGKTTHMDVINPLDIESHKWDEITNKEDPLEQVKYHITSEVGLVFEGNCTTTPVVLPAPDNDLLSHDGAAKAAENTFSNVINTCDITLSQATNKYTRPDAEPFQPIETEEFIDELQTIVTNEVIKQSTPSEHGENRVTRCINELFPSQTEQSKYPDAIYNKNAAMHITRMVLQTLYDLIRTYRTHMSVNDPFNISEHKWDEIPIQ